ncbi:restriction endonuclease subunit S [Cyanobium sp. Morenito 9A2]|uniref:restriction endonuclease subunit S n=1 Tax=Cyanobium sp. Morenito 9A2 TaxID=2823718 RepID=UPI0020CE0B91|nr:restriction endonuclease subunit S [Cyanobium sp. Morenito 9A2]MCP9850839.1 restriction endonuclease subunit S [Cyanobium sp. Morenito 9A2]
MEAGTKEGLQGRFKPYPAYKDSGVEWLGEIPERWTAKRLKFSVVMNPVASELRALPPDTEVSFVPMEAVGEHGGLALSGSKLLVDIGTGYTYFKDGDIVVAKITPCFENGKGAEATGLVNGIAFGTTELHVLRAVACLDQRFLFYITLSDAFRKIGWADMYGAGGQKRVPESFIKNLRHPLPPEPEQRAIATFLDRETARIDALVAKKQRLIDLLQEQRTALITRAATKGLDPTVPMKDSGVEWLGEIPAHWQVKPLKRLFSNLDSVRVPLSGEERSSMAKEYPYYGASGVIDFVEDYLFDEPLILVAEDGANLYSRSSPLAFVAPGKYWVNNHAHILKPVDGDIRYWAQVLSCVVFDPWISGSAQPKLTGEKLGSIPMPVLQLSERQSIAGFLDLETARIDALISKVRVAIARIQELRAALISGTVTGKIDVREEVV